MIGTLLGLDRYRQAQAALAAQPARAELLQRARRRALFARRTLTRPGLLDDESAFELSRELAAQAAHLALGAACGSLSASRTDQWAQADPTLLTRVSAPLSPTAARDLLGDKRDLELIEAPTGEDRRAARRQAEEALALVDRLLDDAVPAQLVLERMRWRWTAIAAATVAVLAGGIVALVMLA
jgi:hypothetical protein